MIFHFLCHDSVIEQTTLKLRNGRGNVAPLQGKICSSAKNELREQPRDVPWGKTLAVDSDPDGHPIELLQKVWGTPVIQGTNAVQGYIHNLARTRLEIFFAHATSQSPPQPFILTANFGEIARDPAGVACDRF